MKRKYIDFVKEVEKSTEYWTETAISDFTEELHRLMQEHELSRTELADEIGVSPAYITKVMRGNVNFTISSMTKLARVFDAVVRIHLAPKEALVKWEDKFKSADMHVDVNFYGQDFFTISNVSRALSNREHFVLDDTLTFDINMKACDTFRSPIDKLEGQTKNACLGVSNG